MEPASGLIGERNGRLTIENVLDEPPPFYLAAQFFDSRYAHASRGAVARLASRRSPGRLLWDLAVGGPQLSQPRGSVGR
jgi:hypothetical protein